MKKTVVITLMSIAIFANLHAVTYEVQNKFDSQVDVKLEADNNKYVMVSVPPGQTATTLNFDPLPTKLTVTITGTRKERSFNLNCSPKKIIQIVPYAIVPEGFSVSIPPA